MNELLDFKGQLIEVGDTVIACVTHGRNSGASLVEFVVERITENYVFGKIPSYTGYISKFSQTKITPKKVYVIEKSKK